MNNKLVLSGIEAYVSGLFHQKYPHSFQYYNIKHTGLLVRATDRLADSQDLTKDELFTLQMAAWFFDIAQLEYWENADHANKSLKTMMKDGGVEEPFLDPILQLLPPRHDTHAPRSLTEQILSDAIRFHWSEKSFTLWTEALRKDTELMQGRPIPLAEWFKQLAVLMETYHYYTHQGKSQIKRRRSNEQKLEEQIKIIEHHNNIVHEHHSVHTVKIDDRERLEKGIETMFKITSSNNQRLTSLGDNKAHILITVNSIILSVIISLLLRKLDDSMFLIYPTFILLGVSLLSMVFAILATRPTIPDGRFSDQDIDDQSCNLLFFGNFYRMSLADYNNAMLRMMDDKKFLYHSLIRDVYGQGIILGKKYLLLRVAYNIFMFGLIISVLAFFLFFVLHHPVTPHVPVKKT